MMEAKDFASGFVGLVIFALGLLPLLNRLGVGPEWMAIKFLPLTIVSWIVAVAALYLVINSIIELTNSNAIGWISVIVAFVALAIGLLPILGGFGIGPDFFNLEFLKGFGQILYNVIFIAEGLFLMVAMFAMEM
ncbi:hypothetical protein HZB03_00075 [Candidatus Woesearchaeota archaeon]|nr:hypothetical protein [Candidatus Woesearchaeota archaeon]